MARLCKTAYNGFNKTSWIDMQEELIKEQYPAGSTWFSPEELENIGCDLLKDLQANGKQSIPLAFVETEEIEF